MNRFILKQLVISGGGHEDSVIEFKNGFNLIVGPSNTGKSLIMDCIDYAFGFTPKSDRPSKIVDNNNGYTHVTLSVQTNFGLVTLKREIGTNTIYVTSSDHNIDSGIYGAGSNTKKSINYALLKLIGINSEHKIRSSKKGKTQTLTWRSILHLFFMKQKDIARETSALLMPGSWKTASGSALLFLLTGKDANDLIKVEDPSINKAKREALIMYIRTKKDGLSQRRQELEESISKSDVENIQMVIDSTTKEISAIQKQLDSAKESSKKLMADLYEFNSKLSECNTVLYNFDALDKQYQSDIQRLGFIVDGHIASSDIHIQKNCPFCNSALKSEPREDYVAAAVAELEKLKRHISDLEYAKSTTAIKKAELEKRIAQLESKKAYIDNYINNELKPRLFSFKETLDKNLKIIRWKDELDFIKENETIYNDDLFEKENEKDPIQTQFNIFSFFDYKLIHEYETELISALSGAHIGGASTARINASSFDVEIDNTSKSTCMGGGYSAVLNTLVAYSMQSYIYKKGGFAPGFFAMDSALTQLSEAEYIKESESVKSNFMHYMLSNESDRQIIMIEQKDELPFLPENHSYNNVNLIEFTRNPNSGRYGFLNDVVNSEHK